jgi:hypothetical protein
MQSMTPGQTADMQATVESQAFEIQRITAKLREFEAHQNQEDLRKRLYRAFTIGGIMAILAMQWWGVAEILQHLEKGC